MSDPGEPTRLETIGPPSEPTGYRLLAAAAGLYVSYALDVREAELTLGRSDEADVLVDHPSVSRLHAVLRSGQHPSIEDLGSSNGTWLGETRLEPGSPLALVPGQVARLGSVSLWIERRSSAPRSEPSEPAPELEVDGVSIVVRAEAMRSLYVLVDRIAVGPINVLLVGETGAGKEIVARVVHARSPRAGGPFAALNCAAFSESLFESELFGHEKGAFSGASEAKPGLLETADGGTILLDEVGELTASSQAKLLRAIEERKVLRLGSLKPRVLDVRIVAATNRDLEEEVEAGRFRRDLYFRLNGVTLHIPPLRERIEEIEPLARLYAQLFAAQLERTPPDLTLEALELLKRHHWPGNLRELRNVVERAVLLGGDGPIGVQHMLIKAPVARTTAHPPQQLAPPASTEPPTPQDGEGSLQDEVESLERDRILAALESCAGNQSRAAKLLGMSRRTLIRKLDRYDLPRPRKGREE